MQYKLNIRYHYYIISLIRCYRRGLNIFFEILIVLNKNLINFNNGEKISVILFFVNFYSNSFEIWAVHNCPDTFVKYLLTMIYE